ncbi:HI0074 family nucleotidyltransferase substrate-binding subunit [Heliorestis convoluta]|uniref:Nucleotidyltransferase n=1 Tax=Heliorestis convoluta TaxID=356322 RepID=A0A5Q2N9U5_9FIRM|nr:HI0074 family nucleotidyltransferase substrate-binding subunit [Heliorestis convoluta]QGG49255.1 hypothetical protein FTV88_3181 [Heliorestis convoluta]
METKREELTIHIEVLKRALATLEEVLPMPYTEIVRDATIQRFEYTFELAWKLFRKVAKIEGIDVASPRQALRTMYELKIIEDIDVWFEFLEDRNRTSHTYNRITAEQVFESAQRMPSILQQSLQKIEQKYTS